MATVSGLVRSFYGWLAKTDQALQAEGLSERIQSLPTTHPTSLPAVTSLALQTARALHGTAFFDKALYWSRLFERIQTEGWQGEIRSVDLDRIRIREELKAGKDGLALQDSRTRAASTS
jgi:hypothetical protein